MGLREKHKHNRRMAIIAAAEQLFLLHGYDGTKSEQIAELSEVSLGTLYNYFTNKSELLLTIMTRENEAVLAQVSAMEISPEDCAATVFNNLFAIYFDPGIVSLNRDLWRRGLSLSYLDVQSTGARALRAIDRELCEQLVGISRDLQSRQKIRDDLDCEIFATLLFNNVNMLFFEYSRSERMTMEQLLKSVHEMTAVMEGLILPPLADGR